MVFTKDDLAVIVTCFTEKGWVGTPNPLDYSTWDILQELVNEGRREPFANLRDLQNVIRGKWHDVDDQTMRQVTLQWKRCLAAVAKQNRGPIQAHFLLTSLTDDYCDDSM